MIKLIVALGNYGNKYKDTRHNVAWQFLSFSSLFNCLTFQEKFSSKIASYNGIYVQTPLTYMNNSGVAVGQAVQFYKIKTEEVLVLHDELELPFGTVSLKNGGGLGGHNGLRSIKNALGDATFIRLRFGISKPLERDIAEYVLSPFNKEEKNALPLVFNTAESILKRLLAGEAVEDLLKEYSKVSVLE